MDLQNLRTLTRGVAVAGLPGRVPNPSNTLIWPSRGQVTAKVLGLQGYGQGSRTCENPDVSNLLDCRPSVSFVSFCHICQSRDWFGFVLRRPRSRHDLRAPHEAVWKHRDRQPRRPLDPVSCQRPRPVRAGEGHRFVGQRGPSAGHDESRHYSCVSPIATSGIADRYLVPNIRSPASPRPGTM
jgi:hypothetical protein